MASNKSHNAYYYEETDSPLCEGMCNNSVIKSGLIVGCVLTGASIMCPSVRKFTVPACKYLAKQQLKLLAGIGILATATYIVNLDKEDNNYS